MNEENTIKLRFNVNRVFNRVYYPHIYERAPLQIFYGGASSGKSHFIAQRVVLTMLQEGRNWLACRNIANTLRASVFNEIAGIIREWGLAEAFDIQHGNLLVTCLVNDAQCLFRGLDDVEKLKSIRPLRGVIEGLWIEEATEASFSGYRDLGLRLRGESPLQKITILSFNPIYKQHWISEKIFEGRKPELGEALRIRDGKVFILRTHYKHNKFLTADDIERIEEYKDDSYRWPVYGMGEWGVLGHVLFTNWRVENLAGREFDHPHNGLDFGFSPDPAAAVRTFRRGKTIYIQNGLYCTGLLNPQLAEALNSIFSRETIYADCAEPKSIAELNHDKKFPCNVLPVKKGKDSVWHGIQWLQQYELVVDESLQWLVNELNVYRLQEDKWGNPIPKKPVDKNNHGIDALRYAWEDEMDLGAVPFLFTPAQSKRNKESKHLPDEEIVVL